MAMREGIQYEILDRQFVVFQRDCGHWIVWRLNLSRGGSPERSTAQLLHGVASGRMACWKCSEDRWRRANGQPARYTNDDRQRTLREIR